MDMFGDFDALHRLLPPQLVYSVQQCREVLAPKMEKSGFVSWSVYCIVLVSSFPLEQSDISSWQQARCNTTTDISQRTASDRSRWREINVCQFVVRTEGRSMAEGRGVTPFMTSLKRDRLPVCICSMQSAARVRRGLLSFLHMSALFVLLTFGWRQRKAFYHKCIEIFIKMFPGCIFSFLKESGQLFSVICSCMKCIIYVLVAHGWFVTELRLCKPARLAGHFKRE